MAVDLSEYFAVSDYEVVCFERSTIDTLTRAADEDGADETSPTRAGKASQTYGGRRGYGTRALRSAAPQIYATQDRRWITFDVQRTEAKLYMRNSAYRAGSNCVLLRLRDQQVSNDRKVETSHDEFAHVAPSRASGARRFWIRIRALFRP